MYFEEYGSKKNPALVMLHGAFFTDTFIKQYPLKEHYHLIIPHIKGFGKAANELFETESAVDEIRALMKDYAPAYLVGFSLGAQLAFKLVSESPELISKAILISPWLVGKDVISDDMMNGNLKMLSQLKSRFFCNMMGLSMGLSREKRIELVNSIQSISEQTVKACVDNGISLESLPRFSFVSTPVLAIAGKKEPEDIILSVKKLSEMNSSFAYELWEGARHNIPTMCAKRLKRELVEFFK